MSKGEWLLWITSTLFQGVLAVHVLWESWQVKKLREMKQEIVSLAKRRVENG